jgi:pentapeptide repeat protein
MTNAITRIQSNGIEGSLRTSLSGRQIAGAGSKRGETGRGYAPKANCHVALTAQRRGLRVETDTRRLDERIRAVTLGLGAGCVLLALLTALDITPWWSFVIAGVVLVVVLLINALWWIPVRQARRFRGQISDKEVFDVENEARRTLVQLVSGIGIVATIAITLYQTNATRNAANRNLRLAAQSQISQRFGQAIDELKATAGDKKVLAPRIGGIYSLAQMAASGQVDPTSVANILSAYVRTEAPAPARTPFPKATSGAFSSCAGNNLFYREPADVAAAVQGLSSINKRFPVRIDLSGTDLVGAALGGVDLDSANLRDAVLVDANLKGADFHHAVLVETDLQGACLTGADLSDTFATEATFDRAHLSGVRLTRACLKGAYIVGFAPQQVAQACVDRDEAPQDELAAVSRVCKSISCAD